MIEEIINLYENLISVLYGWQQNLLVVKIISGVISAWLLFLIIIIARAFIKLTASKIEKTTAPEGKIAPDKVTLEWEKIMSNFQKGDENGFKIAIIEADKLLDEVIKVAGFVGQDMGERLQSITPSQMSNINEIWYAHKFRNKIAHEAGFRVTQNDAQIVMDIYEKTLKDLQVI